MAICHRWNGPVLCGSIVLAVTGWSLLRLAPLHAKGSVGPLPNDSIFESNSNSNDDSGNPIPAPARQAAPEFSPAYMQGMQVAA